MPAINKSGSNQSEFAFETQRKKAALKSGKRRFFSFWNQVKNGHHWKRLFFDAELSAFTAFVLVFVEIFVNFIIINRVKYTEIDWSTYMQQVETFINGTYNYSEIRGDTGPIVYPAGHLYIYSLLYFLTNYGVNVRRAQYFFAVLYIANLIVVFRIYIKTKKVSVLLASVFQISFHSIETASLKSRNLFISLS
ncbi:dol-P-Man:Man(5)GlcNAc(2)-PP-Dol alpha-1:3-mannosyltransferase-like protein [Dinothrombium tinctorium]|uniref:dolichyl-P-Man:Man5GlcNAc2-PP-dolichol alpha-1,3-mannosyltransferase n=1 Tax=Dinothrombium tinctorium TaxID=1965070 RepID=A0A3S3NTY3_9ACAR|nr:dol-P-Man:Man(5)GlcNAc(2)-PP-Dol alpha-1:3-mannosyltransferase-like protein [Dinothrombium tinctorium]